MPSHALLSSLAKGGATHYVFDLVVLLENLDLLGENPMSINRWQHPAMVVFMSLSKQLL